MSWETELIHYYDKMKDFAGTYEQDKNGYSFAMLPIRHGAVKAVLEATIGLDGTFLDINAVPEEDAFTITGVTEDSASRSNNLSPHFLCDTLEYVAGDITKHFTRVSSGGKDNTGITEQKVKIFQKQLNDVADSQDTTDSLKAINCYIQKGCLIQDILSSGNQEIIDMLGQDGNKFHYDLSVRFRVAGAKTEETWKDKELFKLWINYCGEQDLKEKQIISIFSNQQQALSRKTATGVLRNDDASKLFSSNAKGDTFDYTFQGRFHNPEDIIRIGRVDDSKIYSGLKYLLKTAGRNLEDFYLVTWDSMCQKQDRWMFDGKAFLERGAVQKAEITEVRDVDFKTHFDDWKASAENEEKKSLSETAVFTFEKQEFISSMRKAISDERNLSETGEEKKVYILGMRKNYPGQTKGRIAVVEFDELMQSEYLKNYMKWQTEGAWAQMKPVEGGFEYYYGIPSVHDMAILLFGEERNGILSLRRGKGPNMALSTFYQKITSCILCGAPIPRQYVDLVLRRAQNPIIFKKRYNHERIVRLACSFIAKQYMTGDMEMLNVDENDRNYLFGRLLAVADRAERRTYDKINDKNRRTNAEKLMPHFATQPANVWMELSRRLEPYYTKLKVPEKLFYKNLIDEIMTSFLPGDFSNKNLLPVYLLGYSDQRTKLKEYRKADKAADNAKEQGQPKKEVVA